jgi:hypothetical protein
MAADLFVSKVGLEQAGGGVGFEEAGVEPGAEDRPFDRDEDGGGPDQACPEVAAVVQPAIVAGWGGAGQLRSRFIDDAVAGRAAALRSAIIAR